MPPPRILVIEPKWTGHYPMFAGVVADALQAAGATVTLSMTRSDPSETGGLPELVETEMAGRIEIRRSLGSLPGGFSPLTKAGGSREWTVIDEELEALRPDIVLFPSADALACTRSSRDHAGIRMAGCLHNSRLGYGNRGYRFMLRREWMRHHLRGCGMTLGSIDPVPVDASRSPQIHLLPHPLARREGPSFPPPSLRDLDAKIGDRRVVLVIGEHSKRKATDRIVNAWPAPAPPEAVLVVAGRRVPAVNEAIQARMKDDQILDLDRILSTAEFDGLLHRADVVTAIYPGHVGISGVVTEAAGQDSAVLGSAEGGIGRLVTMHGLGTTVPSRSDRALAEALERAAVTDPPVDVTRRRAFVDSCRGLDLGRRWMSFAIGS